MAKGNLEKIAEKYISLHNDWERVRSIVKSEELSLVLSKRFKDISVMEIGLGDGIFTRLLANNFSKVIAVDAALGSIRFTQDRLKKYKNIEYVNSYIEDLKTNIKEKVDNIVMSHILEHVENPVKALKSVKECMHKNTILFISVPNALSLHRQVAVSMGLLKKEDQLIQSDLDLGHQRVYTQKSFHRDIKKAGFIIRQSGGILLKPFSNSQMEIFCTSDMLKGFLSVGRRYPELCGEIYAIIKKEK
ncbi:MAG TPA: class I SAM-dependent methyltransferase [Methanofastidiosum sp.]|nr:class I SAM-dependent methyltransferase [Methanofastidiosum sp.]